MTHPINMFVLERAPARPAFLGTAISCAKGVVLPADFMSSGQVNPLPKAPPATAPTKTEERSVLPWVIGAAAVGGLAWLAWSSGGLASLGVANNPAVSRAASSVWEQAYREALREGLKKREAEEYAFEVLRAYQDDEQNRLGGALDSEEYANPADHGDTVARIVRKAGWSYDLAMSALKSDGVARWHNGLLYVLTDDSGDVVPSDPREPVIVGVYALNEGEGEWVEVGQKDFTDLRQGLRRWNTVQVDMTVVRELGTGPFKPNPAARSSAQKDEADAREMARALQANADAYAAGAVDRATFETRARQYWEIVDAAGLHARVLRIWRKRNPAPNPGRARKLGLRAADFDPKQLKLGTKHELEHTDSERVARQIAMDHLSEDEAYYFKLDAMERGTFRGNPPPMMTVREAMREQEKAKKFWASLQNWQRWELGDEMVLGNIDYLTWFGKRPSSAFMNELDRQRIHWEITGPS